MLIKKINKYINMKILPKIKNLAYLVEALILPFILTFVIAYIIVKFDILKELAIGILKLDLSKINEKFLLVYPNLDEISSLICALIVMLILNIVIYNTRTKNKSVFLKNRNDTDGDYCVAIYKIASLLGYRSINMIGRPIPVQYKILASNCFDEFISGVSEVKNSKPLIRYFNKNLKDYETINLIIGDTYKIKFEDIPENYKNLFSIMITKDDINEKNGKRDYDSSFVDTLEIELHKYEPDNKVINIFAYTNPRTNEELYKKVFVRKSNRLLLNVFYTDEEFKFIDKKTIIKL